MSAVTHAARAGAAAAAVGFGMAVATICGGLGSAQAAPGDGAQASTDSAREAADSRAESSVENGDNDTDDTDSRSGISGRKVKSGDDADSSDVAGAVSRRSSAAPADAEEVTTTLSVDAPDSVDFGVADDDVSTAEQPAPVEVPPPSLWLTAAMDGWRRGLDKVFDDDRPAPDPRQVVQDTETGTIVGTLNTTDEENDRLTYRVIDQPLHGTLTMFGNGTYTYDPNDSVSPELQATGWQEQVRVQVIDDGLSLRKLVDYFGRTDEGVIITVPVTVAPYTSNSAEPAPELNRAMAAGIPTPYTKGFDVVNATPNAIVLMAYGANGQDQAESSPPVGSVLLPGESHHFEVYWQAFGVGEVNPTYAGINSTSLTWTMQLSVSAGFTAQGRCTSSRGAVCNTLTDGPVALMLEPMAPFTIPASDLQKQQDLLAQLCNESARASSCSYAVTSRDDTLWGPSRVVGQIVNDTGEEAQFTRSFPFPERVVGTSSVPLSGSAAARVQQVVAEELKRSYGDEGSTELMVPVFAWLPAHRGVEVSAEPPMVRYNGVFTVKIGNSTFRLEDVSFDRLDANRFARTRTTPIRPSSSNA